MDNRPNILYEPLPREWNGYPINWWFQVGIQIYLVSEDNELADHEKTEIILDLLFAEDKPQTSEEVEECIKWFLNGWNHDRSPRDKEKKKLLDYNNDQWRIYADFRQIYGINLNEASDLHWWEFMGMLWNMPPKQSSFLQVIEIRRKKIKSKMSKEERSAITQAQYVYGLEEKKEQKREYSKEEASKIDAVDEIRMRMKVNKKRSDEALAVFRK